MDSDQLRLHVIRPVLEYLQLDSYDAENLLLGTCAQESRMGHYIKQINGPALGIFQMEPATHNDIWGNYLMYKQDLSDRVIRLIASAPSRLCQMETNLAYQAAIARIHYLRVPEKLPKGDDIEEMARYWKKYYNTEQGKGTEEEFIKNYKEYVKP